MTEDIPQTFSSDKSDDGDNSNRSSLLIKDCSKVISEERFYAQADEYWKSIPATLDGMLGGYERVSKVDIRGSTAFLKSFTQGKNARTKTTRALDCGAGIGRVTKGLLLPLFETVDLAELNKDFIPKK